MSRAGSLLIAWQLSQKAVLVVGGGEVGSQRINSLLATDTHIIVLAPTSGLHPRTQRFINEYPTRITHLDKSCNRDVTKELDEIEPKYDMVLTALDDFELSCAICHYCRERRIPVNAADIPELCDFYFGSQIRDGPLQIMVSTNGNGPKLANIIKTKIQSSLSGSEGAAIEKVGVLRSKLKERAPGVGGAIGKKRMVWMTRLCNEWDMNELGQLDEQTVKRLLDEGWDKDHVPTPTSLGLKATRKPLSLLFSNPVIPGVIGFLGGVACAAAILISRKK